MAGRRFTRGRSVGQRRETLWVSMAPVIDTADSAAVLISSANAALLALRPFTIIRTYFSVEFGSDQSAATETQVAAVGMAVVSEQASAIGVTAVPTPITDIGSDLWYVHQNLLAVFQIKSSVGFDPKNSTIYEIHSKAMRKVNGDQDVVLVYEDSAVGTGGSTITTIGRFLIKLH